MRKHPDISDLIASVPQALSAKVKATPQQIPLTSEEVKQLEVIVEASEASLMPVFGGLIAIGRVLGEVDCGRDPDVVSRLGWLVMHLAEEARTVESLKSDAEHFLQQDALLKIGGCNDANQ